MSLTESSLQRGLAQRDDHFQDSREATARVGKAFTYPHIDGQLVKISSRARGSSKATGALED